MPAEERHHHYTEGMPMNRKAETAFEIGSWVFFVFLFGMVVAGLLLATAFVFTSYKNKLTDVPEQLQAELIALRFSNNPACFAAVESITGKVYAHSIELSKFTAEQLRKCYPQEGLKTMQFRLKLANQGTEITTADYYYQDDFVISTEVQVYQGQGHQQDRLIIYVRAGV